MHPLSITVIAIGLAGTLATILVASFGPLPFSRYGHRMLRILVTVSTIAMAFLAVGTTSLLVDVL